MNDAQVLTALGMPGCMGQVQGACYDGPDLQNRSNGRQLTIFERIREVDAFDVLHDDCIAIIYGDKVDDLENVVTLKQAQESSFIPHPGDKHLFLGVIREDDLDRYLAAKTLVGGEVCFVHGAECASADCFGKAERPHWFTR